MRAQRGLLRHARQTAAASGAGSGEASTAGLRSNW